MTAKIYNQIKNTDIEKALLSGPGSDLIPKMIMQMAKIKGFTGLFGPFKGFDGKGDTEQRWADYQRYDWSIRQLPAICAFESQTESKESDNAFLNGTITIQIYWPPNFRRPDARRVEVAFKGAMENFFASKYTQTMLDELYWIERPEKVYGLNQLGKELTWTPNVESIVEDQLVPVTILDVRYRIDLRAWYRALEHMNRTREEPFLETLADLIEIGGPDLDSVYQGTDNEEIEIEIPDSIKVNE